jgi:HEAT repeat protein
MLTCRENPALIAASERANGRSSATALEPEKKHTKRDNMKTSLKRMLAVTVAGLVLATNVSAKEKTEAELIADLSSPKPAVVTDALQQIEKKYPTSAAAIAKTKQLLTDNRSAVRRKAARVLGALHADLTQQEMQNVVALLKADPQEQMDGLKALRGLKAQSTIPDIVPLLKSATPNVARDACRTLAVLGNKDVIPSIEPLLSSPNKALAKDAQDAIFALKNK